MTEHDTHHHDHDHGHAGGRHHGHHHGHDNGHHHGHAHSHGHVHAPKDFGAVFAIGTSLNLALVFAELGFGYAANSLALISDGVHNFSDVVGLLLAWGGSWLATRQPTRSRTYGYRGASILAALGNAALLLVVTGGIFIEALQRLFDTRPVVSGTVMWVAVVAIIINTATALLFMRGRESDLNIRGAFIHMAGDAAVSLGVVIAAVLIGLTGWQWLDPVVSMAIAAVILWSSWGLARSALNLAVAAVPTEVDRDAVESYLAALPGVQEVHDLHIWAMSTTEVALTAHLVRSDVADNDVVLHDAAHELARRFGIHHPTLQIERGTFECHLAPEHVV